VATIIGYTNMGSWETPLGSPVRSNERRTSVCVHIIRNPGGRRNDTPVERRKEKNFLQRVREKKEFRRREIKRKEPSRGEKGFRWEVRNCYSL